MLLTMPTMRVNGRRRAEKGWSSAHDTPSAVGTCEEFAISSTVARLAGRWRNSARCEAVGNCHGKMAERIIKLNCSLPFLSLFPSEAGYPHERQVFRSTFHSDEDLVSRRQTDDDSFVSSLRRDSFENLEQQKVPAYDVRQDPTFPRCRRHG
jgi:hypothetical protein